MILFLWYLPEAFLENIQEKNKKVVGCGVRSIYVFDEKRHKMKLVRKKCNTELLDAKNYIDSIRTRVLNGEIITEIERGDLLKNCQRVLR